MSKLKTIKNVIFHIIIFFSLLMMIYSSLVVLKFFSISKFLNKTTGTDISFKYLFFHISFHTIIVALIILTMIIKLYTIHRKNLILLQEQKENILALNTTNTLTLDRFEDFINTIEEGLYEANLDGEIIFATPKLASMFDYSSYKELLGENILSFITDNKGKSFEELQQKFKKCVKNGNTTTEKYTITTKTGKQKHIVVQISIKKDFDNNPKGIRGVVFDITNIVKLQNDYEANYKKLKLVVDSLPIPLYIQSMQGEIIQWNKAFQNLINKKYEEIENKTIFNIYPAGMSSICYEKTIELMRSKNVLQNFHVNFNNKNLFVTQVKFINKYDKFKSNIIGIIQDLSILEEINHLQEDLQISEETFKVITENSLLGVVIVKNKSISYMNDKSAEILGYQNHEILLNDSFFKEIIHPSNINKFNKIREIIKIQNKVKSTLKIVDKNNKIKFVEIELKKINYNDSQSLLITILDLSRFVKIKK